MSAAGDAALVAALFAVDPAGTGVCLRSPVHPVRDQWLQMLRELLPAAAPLRRIPFNIADERLLGGLDLAATLKANRPIAERGALAAADGGVVVVSMAERLSAHTAACMNAVVDAGEVTMSREGVSLRYAARIGVVALDEGSSEDEFVPASVLDRMAFLLDFNGFNLKTVLTPPYEPEQILGARAVLSQMRIDPELLRALCATALVLGAGSPRVSLLAARAAAAAAALDGRVEVSEDDVTLAARLVLAPRATVAPPAAPERPNPAEERADPADEPADSAEDRPEERANPAEEPSSAAQPPSNQPQPPPNQPEGGSDVSDDRSPAIDATAIQDAVLAAARAAIPAGLLARLAAGAARLGAPGGAGRAGAQRHGSARGRPCGVRSGAPRRNARLNVIETLRAAAPWQSLRGRHRQDSRVLISADDFRVTRYRQRAQTLTIFAVDASGSSALHRLAEAKGAVELLLAECYIRRDQVAVIGFRGRTAEVLLPPTRSLVRAKRSLAAMAGGGGTPLTAAIESALKIANQAQRRGETPTIVFLTDGRANVTRNGTGGREAAHTEALRTAVALRASKLTVLFIDTSPRPNDAARDLARKMNARYIPLPFADARVVSDIVRSSANGSLDLRRQRAAVRRN